MADDQYEAREQNMLNSMPSHMAGFMLGAIQADAAGKRQAASLLLDFLKQGNVNLDMFVTLIGMSEKMQMGMNLPAAFFGDHDMLAADEVTLDFNLDVHAEQSDDFQLHSKTHAEGHGSISFGFFGKIGMGFSADVGVDNDRKRSSDYTSGCKVQVVMKQKPAPETVKLILDMMAQVTKMASQANKEIVRAQQNQILEKVQNDPPDLTPPPEDNGDGGTPKNTRQKKAA
ncbi:MAG: DUF2589 domain-containing protein [Gemmatimonadetes bacterium]|nr:DUF2589 domain-containing protein [Gemmatimonadota bacterium]